MSLRFALSSSMVLGLHQTFSIYSLSSRLGASWWWWPNDHCLTWYTPRTTSSPQLSGSQTLSSQNENISELDVRLVLFVHKPFQSWQQLVVLVADWLTGEIFWKCDENENKTYRWKVGFCFVMRLRLDNKGLLKSGWKDIMADRLIYYITGLTDME